MPGSAKSGQTRARRPAESPRNEPPPRTPAGSPERRWSRAPAPGGPATATQEEIEAVVRELNDDPACT
ncbi:hypothetical protein, partial [Streptomyces sp. NPDC002172]